MMRNSHLTLASAVLAATILWSPTVSAGPIDPGFDLFSTESGTIEIPGLGLGPTDLKGIPGGPGNADIIVERQPPPLPATGTIDVEIVSLQLRSVAPVDIGGTMYDMFIGLDSGNQSLGQYDITIHNDTASDRFDSFFDVFVEIELFEVGNPGNNFSLTQNFIMNASDAPWSHTPPPPYPINPLFPSGGFYPDMVTYTGSNQEIDLTLNLETAMPEPGTFALFGLGLAGLGLARRKRAVAMFKKVIGMLIGLAVLGTVGTARALPITNTYSYQGVEVAPGNTITGSFSVTSSSFSGIAIDLANAGTCAAYSCSFLMTNGIGLNTNWSPSTIGGGSNFGIYFDTFGNIENWYIFVGSGQNVLFATSFSPFGDAVDNNGTWIPGPGSSNTNNSPGAWTLVSSTGGSPIPEPGTLALFGLSLAGLGFARRRKAAA